MMRNLCFLSLIFIWSSVSNAQGFLPSQSNNVLKTGYNTLRVAAQEYNSKISDGRRTWAFASRTPVLVPPNISPTGQATEGMLMWVGHSSCAFCFFDYINFRKVQNGYDIYFLEYDSNSKLYGKVIKISGPTRFKESYEQYFEGDGWCNRGFNGGMDCTPPKMQRWDLGLGQEVDCGGSSSETSICFELEFEIERNRTRNSYGGQVRLNSLSGADGISDRNSESSLVELWLTPPNE